MSQQSEVRLTLRPAMSSYLIFCGIWVALTVGYVLLAVRRPGNGLEFGAVISGSVALAAALWLNGHRVQVASGVLEYRDGFYRSQSILLANIESLTNTWEKFAIFGRDIAVPRLRVVGRNDVLAFQINPKPFSRNALQELSEVVRTNDRTSR